MVIPSRSADRISADAPTVPAPADRGRIGTSTTPATTPVVGRPTRHYRHCPLPVIQTRPDTVELTTPSPDQAATDADLVARIAAGDDDTAIRELYARYGSRLYGFALQRVHDTSLAEEMVQDVFTRLWRSAASFDPTLSSVPSFLFLLARRSAIDLHRRAAARPVLSSDEPPDHPAPTDRQDQALATMAVREALEHLSDVHRETLTLQLDHGLTVRELADRMGIPLGTAKSRRFNALRELRTHLEERGLDG